MTKIVGVDLSLTSTGISVVETTPLGHEVTLHRVQSKPPPADRVTLYTRSRRLRGIAQTIFTHCQGAGLVVIEGPSYASESGAAHDRAGEWWMVVGRLTAQGFNVTEVPPTLVKQYATGKGNAGKDAVLAATVRRFPHVEVDGNDVADALVLASLGCRFIGRPIDEPLPQSHTRAMARIKWHLNPSRS